MLLASSSTKPHEQKRHRGTVIVVTGNAGVGKTTWARQLARSLCSNHPLSEASRRPNTGAAVFDIDATTGAVIQAGLKAAGMNPDDRDSPKYKALFRDAIHYALFDACREQLIATNGMVPCIIIAPFTKERRRADFPQVLRKLLVSSTPTAAFEAKKDPTLVEYLTHEVDIHPVLVRCDPRVREQRIRSRGHPRDVMKFAPQGAKSNDDVRMRTKNSKPASIEFSSSSSSRDSSAQLHTSYASYSQEDPIPTPYPATIVDNSTHNAGVLKEDLLFKGPWATNKMRSNL